MDIAPQIFNARVMHKRFMPRENQFSYDVYYLVIPLSHLSRMNSTWVLRLNHFGLHSIHQTDHGARDGGDLERWIRGILDHYGLNTQTNKIMLVTMPRLLGYAFNPVSFWLCLDTTRQLRAVLCEVNNTFGETHNYLCAQTDHSPILATDWLEADKVFHVSPFLERDGHYRFRFSLNEQRLAINIDYHSKTQRKQLVTSLSGSFEPLTKKSLLRAFFRHPLVTAKVIALIHWQAVKLMAKGIKYIKKPRQLDAELTGTRNIKKI